MSIVGFTKTSGDAIGTLVLSMKIYAKIINMKVVKHIFPPIAKVGYLGIGNYFLCYKKYFPIAKK